MLIKTRRASRVCESNKRNILYFINVRGFNIYKIGISYDQKTLKKRIHNLRQNNLLDIYVDFFVIVDDANKLEKDLHKKYSKHNIKNEWFNIHKYDLISEMNNNNIDIVCGSSIMKEIRKEKTNINILDIILPI